MKTLTAILACLTLHVSAADIPDQASGEFRGMYKVAASNDPIFPVEAGREWFLDFGKGVSPGKLSGSVAVSLRENPNVRVRILAWQYFPKQGMIVLGNPYSEGSKNAVAKGTWTLSTTSRGALFDRGNHQIVLHRADPADY